MACNVQIPVDDIAEEVKQLLNLDQYVKQDNGTANNLTLKGGVILDSATKRDLCEALSDCFDDKHVSEFRLNGNDLEISLTDGTRKTVDLSLFNPHDKYVEKNGGTLTNGVLSTPTIIGAVSLDSNATESLCSALEQCIRDYIADTPFVDSGELDGTTLVLKQGDSVINRIPLGDLVPPAKADRFLSSVTYNRDGKRLEFVTSAMGEQDKTFTIPLDDMVNVPVNPENLAGDGLIARDGKLHVHAELCTLNIVTNAAYTVQPSDDVILATGGAINFPTSIPVGRAFTVIQTTDAEVTLTSDGTLHQPQGKTLVVMGKNSAVTVIKTSPDIYYVVGDMK